MAKEGEEYALIRMLSHASVDARENRFKIIQAGLMMKGLQYNVSKAIGYMNVDGKYTATYIEELKKKSLAELYESDLDPVAKNKVVADMESAGTHLL